MPVDEVISAQPNYAAYRVERARKRDLLKHLLASSNDAQYIIFVRTKHAAGRLFKQLEANEHSVLLAHNGMGKVRRNDVLTAYLAGEAKILVASDMALRGLEIPSSTGYVINLDVPTTLAAAAQRQMCMQQATENIFLLAWDEEDDFAKLLESLEITCELVEFAGFAPDPEVVEAEKVQQLTKAEEATTVKKDGVRKLGKRQANGRHKQKEKHKQRLQSNHYVDENGDANGNTLSSDNSNRSAIELASDGAVLHRRGRGKTRQRVDGNR